MECRRYTFRSAINRCNGGEDIAVSTVPAVIYLVLYEIPNFGGIGSVGVLLRHGLIWCLNIEILKIY